MNSYDLPSALQNRYISVETFNRKLKKLPGVELEIPKSEIKRLEALLPESISTHNIKEIRAVTAKHRRK